MFNLYRRNDSLPDILRDLIWPMPLLAVSALHWLHYPLLVSAAVFIALAPWLARQFVFNQPFQKTDLDAPLLWLAGGAGLGLWVSYSFMVSLPTFLMFLGSLSVYYSLVHTTLSPRFLAAGLVLMGVAIAALFVGQTLAWWPPAGFTPHPNAVAGFLLIPFFPALWLIRYTTGPERWAWLAGSVLMTAGLLLSGSRGAWFGLAVALAGGAMLFAPPLIQRVGAVALGVTGGILAGLMALFLTYPGASPPVFLHTVLENFDTRLGLYRHSLSLWADYPLTGVGLGEAFAQVYSRYQLLIVPDYVFYPHNMVLAIALGFGLPGLVGLFWLSVNLVRLVLRTERASLGDEPESLLFRAGWLGLVAVFLHGLIDSPYFSNYLWTMPMFFAGLALVVITGQPAISSAFSYFRLTGWFSLIAAIVLLVSGLIFWRPLVAAWHLNWGAVYQAEADLALQDGPTYLAAEAGAKAHFERVLMLQPDHPSAHRRLGMIALNHRQFDTALAHLRQADQLQPGNQTTLKALALAFRGAGHSPQAIPLLNRLDPTDGITTVPNIWNY